jgi:AraC family transcriptional regulator
MREPPTLNRLLTGTSPSELPCTLPLDPPNLAVKSGAQARTETAAATRLEPHAAHHIGQAAHAQPDWLVAPDDAAPLAALWSHSPVVAQVSGLAQHTIALHLAGCTLVEKWVDGRLQGHHSRIGSVSLVPAQVSSTWVLSGHSRVAHVYVDPQRLAAAAAGAEGPACTATLRDFFAEPDEVLAAWVRLLFAQAHAGTLDALAHDELMAVLLRHLLQRYASGKPLAPASTRLTLTAATLRRVFEHIEDHLAYALRLPDLAAIARLSDDHFLRAFKAAVGATPHQYLLARRIAHTQQLLARGGLPIADVARAGGFRGASHFSAVFKQRTGASPSQWRADRQGT